MRVEVIDAGGAALRVHEIRLDGPITVAEALARAGVVVPEGGAVGVHGRLHALDHVLDEGDRVEVYGPLLADPKQARRARARRQRLS
jgi:putative ubiquitin-RnfH superfamily antitoxin RatB of RatAB toxin-antitoxin module